MLESFSRVSLVLHQKLQFSLKLVHLRLDVVGRHKRLINVFSQSQKLVQMNEGIIELLLVSFKPAQNLEQLILVLVMHFHHFKELVEIIIF